MREAVSFIHINQSREILLLRKGDAWILPGGKPEPGEQRITCLLREAGEELPEAKVSPGIFFGSFTGTTPTKGDKLTAHVYWADLIGSIEPGAEISESRFVASQDFSSIYISDITRRVLEALITEGHF